MRAGAAGVGWGDLHADHGVLAERLGLIEREVGWWSTSLRDRAAEVAAAMPMLSGALAVYADAVRHPCEPTHPREQCIAVPRPVTPAYPVITAAFSTAVDDILAGAPVAASLHRAATTIDADTAKNHGYQQADGTR